MHFENIVEFHSYNRIGELFYILHKNNRKFLNNALGEYDLNLLQAMCLLIINEKEDISQKELTDLLFATKSGITKSIRNLEIDGFIKRETSKIDGRQHILILTKKGLNILPIINEINQKWEDGLDLNELDDSFFETLNQLVNKSIDLNSK